mmetsp:Transcript_87400/g.255592  ORF Transcript_87400/g.255592 Transcript_87400/m.255592 type:complete len:225 (+) Transcript_87400:2705-3379(+)
MEASRVRPEGLGRQVLRRLDAASRVEEAVQAPTCAAGLAHLLHADQRLKGVGRCTHDGQRVEARNASPRVLRERGQQRGAAPLRHVCSCCLDLRLEVCGRVGRHGREVLSRQSRALGDPPHLRVLALRLEEDECHDCMDLLDYEPLALGASDPDDLLAHLANSFHPLSPIFTWEKDHHRGSALRGFALCPQTPWMPVVEVVLARIGQLQHGSSGWAGSGREQIT